MGKTNIIWRVNDIPHWSATHPRMAAPIPPMPIPDAKINPDAIPRFLGIRLCPMAMVTELEERIVRPAAMKNIRGKVPSVKKKKWRNRDVRARLMRAIRL